MDEKYLNQITTQWSEIEGIIEENGPAALANFLVTKYFSAIKKCFQTLCAVDDMQAHEFASSVMYELIKNDYRGLKRLDRHKGNLRGLLYRIAKAQVAQDHRHRKFLELQEIPEKSDTWLDIYLDLQQALDNMQQQRPLLHRPFVAHYLEGKTLVEISQELKIAVNAIKQRLFSARRWLAQELREYHNDT